MKTPLVSVIMPIYNNEAYAGAAIQSMLDQTLTDFEFIIIDDGSNAATQTLLANYAVKDDRIILLRNLKNLGLTPSLNKGLDIARGKYVARQDADDISLPRRLESQVAYLESHTAVGLLGTSYKVIDREGTAVAKHLLPQVDTDIRWRMLFHSAFCHTAVIFRRSLLSRYQLKYDAAMLHIEDFDLWARMLLYTKAANLSDELVYLRKHAESVSAINHASQQYLATWIAERQIRLLWAEHPFSLSDIATLRQWYNRFPAQLTRQEMILCQSLLHLLAIFAQQPGIDSLEVAHINLHWTRRILKALHTPEQWLDLVSSGLLKTLLRYSVPAALVFMPSQLVRKAKRHFRKISPANT